MGDLIQTLDSNNMQEFSSSLTTRKLERYSSVVSPITSQMKSSSTISSSTAISRTAPSLKTRGPENLEGLVL